MATIDLKRLSVVQRALDELAANMPEAVVSHLQEDEARPLMMSMRSRAGRYGRMGRRAAATLQYTHLHNGGSIRGGGGGGLGAVLFAGTEYGGRKRRLTYGRRNRSGSGSHSVTRRTTMMFLPHTGSRGYWFWPSIRQETQGIVGRVEDVIVREVGRLG